MRSFLTNSVIVSTLLIMMSCNSNKTIVENKTNDFKEKNTALSNKMITENFKRAQLFKDKENHTNCNLTIKINGSEQSLDPINIEESFLASISDKQNIWIKFQSLRMKNRCDQARPIKIIEIKKRDE